MALPSLLRRRNMEMQLSDRRTARFMLTMENNGTTTTSEKLLGRPIAGLFLPVLNGTPLITFQVSLNDITFMDLLDEDGATDAISIQGGVAAFAVSSDDLSPLAAYASNEHVWVRLKSSVAQSPARAFVLLAMA